MTLGLLAVAATPLGAVVGVLLDSDGVIYTGMLVSFVSAVVVLGNRAARRRPLRRAATARDGSGAVTVANLPPALQPRAGRPARHDRSTATVLAIIALVMMALPILLVLIVYLLYLTGNVYD